eukprot:2036891-Rhodomonas_salina.2
MSARTHHHPIPVLSPGARQNTLCRTEWEGGREGWREGDGWWALLCDSSSRCCRKEMLQWQIYVHETLFGNDQQQVAIFPASPDPTSSILPTPSVFSRHLSDCSQRLHGFAALSHQCDFAGAGERHHCCAGSAGIPSRAHVAHCSIWGAGDAALLPAQLPDHFLCGRALSASPGARAGCDRVPRRGRARGAASEARRACVRSGLLLPLLTPVLAARSPDGRGSGRVHAGTASVYGGTASVYGGCSAAVYGSAPVYGGTADMYGTADGDGGRCAAVSSLLESDAEEAMVGERIGQFVCELARYTLQLEVSLPVDPGPSL